MTDRGKISLVTAIAIVVANMVGTGVFTSLGFQLMGLSQLGTIIVLWLLGGLIAICGALTYAELAAHLPGSGGEYHYLSRLMHPGIGFMAAWVSATVGFSAPIALAATALAHYGLANDEIGFLGLGTAGLKIFASSVIIVIATIHSVSLKQGSRFQVFFTVAKVLVMCGIIMAGCWLLLTGSSALQWPAITSPENRISTWSEILSAPFATSLIYVSYSYSGWNAATYLSGDVERPQRNVPLALLIGTALVTLLYVGVNWSFMQMAPATMLKGELEVGGAAINHAFGEAAGRTLSTLIAILLLSTISAMLMAGPRLLAALGAQVGKLSFLSSQTSSGLPWLATVMMTSISLVFIWTGTFESIMAFSGGVMSLFTMLTTASVFILRFKQRANLQDENNSSRTALFTMPIYPVPAVIFLALNAYMLFFLALDRPLAFAASAALVAGGSIIYWLSSSRRS